MLGKLVIVLVVLPAIAADETDEMLNTMDEVCD